MTLDRLPEERERQDRPAAPPRALRGAGRRRLVPRSAGAMSMNGRVNERVRTIFAEALEHFQGAGGRRGPDRWRLLDLRFADGRRIEVSTLRVRSRQAETTNSGQSRHEELVAAWWNHDGSIGTRRSRSRRPKKRLTSVASANARVNGSPPLKPPILRGDVWTIRGPIHTVVVTYDDGKIVGFLGSNRGCTFDDRRFASLVTATS